LEIEGGYYRGKLGCKQKAVRRAGVPGVL